MLIIDWFNGKRDELRSEFERFMDQVDTVEVEDGPRMAALAWRERIEKLEDRVKNLEMAIDDT